MMKFMKYELYFKTRQKPDYLDGQISLGGKTSQNNKNLQINDDRTSYID